MTDNKTHLSSEKYDVNIERTVPFYSEFYRQIIDLVKARHIESGKWLDTGCGTGTLVYQAIKTFPSYTFTLCDPSDTMLSQAKEKLQEHTEVTQFCLCKSQELDYCNEFDIVTSVQAHHYLLDEERITATSKCYKAIKPEGLFVAFENFAPNGTIGKTLAMDRWGRYQKAQGMTVEEVETHQLRYGVNYFPVSIREHLDVLAGAGFSYVDILWLSYMQVGLYAIK